MKNLFLTLCFSFFSLTLAQQKGLIATYGLQTILDDKEAYLRNMGTDNMPYIEKIQAVDRALNEIHHFKLSIDNDISSFKYEEKINNNQDKGKIRIIMMPAREWFIDLLNSIKIGEAYIMDEKCLLKDSLEVFDWKITREKKKVFNIEARKAIAIKDSVEYTAWYAPSIPLSHGPNAITGLPGLIMELDIYYPHSKTKPHHHFWVIGLETKENVKIKIPEKTEFLTEEEYHKNLKSAYEKYKEMIGSDVERD